MSGFEQILLDNGQPAMMRKGMSHDEAAAKLKAMGIDAVPTVPFATPSGETIPMRYNMTPEEARAFGLLDEVYSKRPGSEGTDKR